MCDVMERLTNEIYLGVDLCFTEYVLNYFTVFFPDPDFVNSFEYKDHIYFFFREAAVEYINCGKVTFCQ